MIKKYSPSTGGFYTVEWHGTDIPSDAVDLSDNEYEALLAGVYQGKIIVISQATGLPTTVDAPAAPPQVPISITKLQAKLAVGEAVVAQVNAFMNDPSSPWAMRTAWEDATDLYRNSQMVDELAWVLGMDPSELDSLFISAAQILV